MFSIVEFQMDMSCEISPKTWLRPDDKCLWPPIETNPDDLSQMIRRMLTPGPDWGEYKIRILGDAGQYFY